MNTSQIAGNPSIPPIAAARQTRAALGAAALLSALGLMSGCVVAVRPAPVVYTQPAVEEPGGEVVVDSDPPPPQYEVVGVAPGPGYVWIGGYYHWAGARWVWYGGHYERPPHPGARWVAARYEFRAGSTYEGTGANP
jgi:hypothetical protein